jgi:hypothetical protein
MNHYFAPCTLKNNNTEIQNSEVIEDSLQVMEICNNLYTHGCTDIHSFKHGLQVNELKCKLTP